MITTTIVDDIVALYKGDVELNEHVEELFKSDLRMTFNLFDTIVRSRTFKTIHEKEKFIDQLLKNKYTEKQLTKTEHLPVRTPVSKVLKLNEAFMDIVNNFIKDLKNCKCGSKHNISCYLNSTNGFSE